MTSRAEAAKINVHLVILICQGKWNALRRLDHQPTKGSGPCQKANNTHTSENNHSSTFSPEKPLPPSARKAIKTAGTAAAPNDERTRKASLPAPSGEISPTFHS